MNAIDHIGKISGLLSVPINGGRRTGEESGDEFRDDTRIIGRGVLPGTKNIEKAQRDGLKIIKVGEELTVIFPGELTHRIR